MQNHTPASIQLSIRDAHLLRSLLVTSSFASNGDATLRQSLARLVADAATYPESPQRTKVVALYDRVTVAPLDTADPDLIHFELVTPVESPSVSNRISVLAPLGLGVLGRSLGEVVSAPLPSGPKHYRIVAVQKSGSIS